jgi:hypothetical protein
MKMMSALFLDGTEAANMKLFIELISLMVMYSAKNKCEDLHNVADCHWIYVPDEIEKEWPPA